MREALLTVSVALPCYFPARRAMRIEPMAALRHE
jgi:ABC-type lipoprotein release transport system permease subunit